MHDGGSAGKGVGTESPSGAAVEEWVARTETRAFSPSFSPFTHTTAAGNGIANPSTLHASWQLVISRPVLRQHTPRYVSHPHRVVVLVAPPSTQEYPLDLEFLPLPASLSLSFSLLFSFTYFLPLHFPSLFSLTVLHIRFSLFLPSTHFAVFLRRDIFLPNFFRFSHAFRTSYLLSLLRSRARYSSRSYRTIFTRHFLRD